MMDEGGRSAFVEMFGDSPLIRVVDFFLMYRDFDYSKTEVAREVRMSPITIEKIWEHLIKKEFIIETKRIGHAKLYRLNKENQLVQQLLKLDAWLIMQDIEKEKKAILIEA